MTETGDRRREAGNALTLVKYALALAGIALVLLADSVGRPWVGYVGLGVLAVAFLLRFLRRSRRAGSQTG